MDTGQKPKINKVLFSDLDGTLIKTLSGNNFPIACYDMQPRFDTLAAIKLFKPDIVCIVTNQGGIEKGFVNRLFFENKCRWISSIIAEGCRADCVYDYCDTTDDNDIKRKPNPGMINRFKEHFNKYFSDNCTFLMIGDRFEDELCAKNANISYLNVEDFIKEYKPE